MRRSLVLAVVLALAGTLSASALAAPVFFVRGNGWGHGIGMAQYGAYGFALHGREYPWILNHFYKGTTLGTHSGMTIKVRLATGGRLSVGSDAPAKVTSGGLTFSLPAGKYRIGQKVKDVNGKLRTIKSPALFRRTTKPVELGSRRFRGSIQLTSTFALNLVPLESYLRGVVPLESPSSWPFHALAAQAVAARSYAIVSMRGRAFLYPTTRDQVYGGLGAEKPSSNAAVQATRGKVVVYGGNIVQTFFHSTSGGKTAAIQDVWTGATPRPYFVSVDDPWDTLSPYHRWGPLRMTVRGLRARLGSAAIPARTRDLTVQVNGSSRAGSVTAHGATTAQTAASTFQAALGLRSTWFRIGVLRLAPAARSVVYGRNVGLRGYARGVSGITLWQRPYGGAWEHAAAVTPKPDHTFTAVAKPLRTTWYRLRSSSGVGAPVRVAVALKVGRPAKPSGVNALAGRIWPARAGAEVRIQKLAGGAWKNIARLAHTDSGGRYSIPLSVKPATYRAVAYGLAGYVRGVSPTLIVGS